MRDAFENHELQAAAVWWLDVALFPVWLALLVLGLRYFRAWALAGWLYGDRKSVV